MKRNHAMGWSCKLCMRYGILDLSIMFVDKDFDTYMCRFVGSPSIDMAKSIYGLGFDSLGRQLGLWGFVAVAIT
jgi:hypothetical protein